MEKPTPQRYYYNVDGTINYNSSNIGISAHSKIIPFEFEKIDWVSAITWIHNKWHYPLIASSIYLALIFGIQNFMKNRKPFELKKPLFLWNAALGIFSIIGFCRTAPEFFDTLTQPNGFYASLCLSNNGTNVVIFWSIAFGVSKYVELGDTLFIVLRKKPLQFLQWYHHIVTLAVAYWSLPYLESISRYYVVMNFGVHSLMYPYFALRALDIKIPKRLANIITTLQLSQMVVGLLVNSCSIYLYYSGVPCLRHPFTIKMCWVMYASFVAVFGELYYRLVIQKNKKIQ